MMNQCTLCGSADLTFALRFPDVDGNLVDLYECQQCDALIPDFKPTAATEALKQQVDFHEDWWKDSTAEELERDLRSMASVIAALQPVLGAPGQSPAAVIELGCGRGTMLRALLDAGYPALGCEPSARLTHIARTHYGLTPAQLFEMPAEEFLEGPVARLAQRPRAVILWHVLEHLPNPLALLDRVHSLLPADGHLILQLPILHQPYVYPEHYFFVNDSTLHYLAERCGYSVVSVEYDKNNFFITACLKKSEAKKASTSVRQPKAATQAILLRDSLIAEQRQLIDERWAAMQSMEAMIRQRDEASAAQAKLLEERWSAMQSMEKKLAESHAAMQSMQRMIGERDAAIAAQTKLIDERWAAMQSMQTMIAERDQAIAAQAQLIEERWAAMQSMQAMIRERDALILELRQLLEKRPTVSEATSELLSSVKASVQYRLRGIAGSRR